MSGSSDVETGGERVGSATVPGLEAVEAMEPGRPHLRLAGVAVVAAAAAIGFVVVGSWWGRNTMLDRVHRDHVDATASGVVAWSRAWLAADSGGRNALEPLRPGQFVDDQAPDYLFSPTVVAPSGNNVVVIGQVVTQDRVTWLRVDVAADTTARWCLIRPPQGDPAVDRCDPTLTL